MPSSYAIGTHFENFIQQQIESGRYAVQRIVANILPFIDQTIEIGQVLWLLGVEERPDIPDKAQ